MGEYDYVLMIVAAIVGIPAIWIANKVLKAFWFGLSGLALKVFGDLPSISGVWKATFTEPSDAQGTSVLTKEKVTLHQFGRLVWGTSLSLDELGRSFRYRGHITRDVFLGQFKPKKKTRSITGAGAFQLVISGSDDRMIGACMWYDYDTDQIETSDFVLEHETSAPPARGYLLG